MKPSSLFVSSEDFSNRFKDTFIYYKGVPKYVQACSMPKPGDLESLSFNIVDFKKGYDPDSESEIVLLNDEGINFRQYNLGYCNYDNYGAVWVARTPARQWKQGLRKDQCQFAGATGDDTYMVLAPTPHTFNTLMNIYSTYEEAIDFLRINSRVRKLIKVPIHKNFAVYTKYGSTNIVLEYKGLTASTNDSSSPKLLPNFKYLMDIPEYAKFLKWLSK